jgi:agmatinase
MWLGKLLAIPGEWGAMGQPDMFKSPQFAQIATFARLPHTRDLDGVDVAFIGVPWDDATSFRPGARFGPAAVREASRRLLSYNPHFKVKTFDALKVVDYGDVDIYPGYIDDTYRLIEDSLQPVVAQGVYPLVCGGDHSISFPILKVLAKRHGPLSLVHFDAHDDCTTSRWVGTKHDHSTPFGKGVEVGLIAPDRSIHIGMRGSLYDPAQLREIEDMGYHFLTADGVARMGVPEALRTIREVARAPSYVTFDIDAVDPAFAPGTGTPEIAGLTAREARDLVWGLAGIGSVGFDMVEVAPAYDPSGITSILASNLLYEFLSLMAREREDKKARTTSLAAGLAGIKPLTTGEEARPGIAGRAQKKARITDASERADHYLYGSEG